MKKIIKVLLFTIIFFFVACQQKPDVYIQNNCIYFRGEKILEGNNEVIFSECLFMKELNKIIYIQGFKWAGYELDIREILAGIFSYDIETKNNEQIISCEEYECYFRNLVKLSENVFYYAQQIIDDGTDWNYSYKYSFSTKEVSQFSGFILDVIPKGKYKDCLVVSSAYYTDSPCNEKYSTLWITDSEGNSIGCIDFIDFDDEDGDYIKYDYNNIKFIEPPKCNFEKDLDLWYDVAKNGLEYIRQYQQGNKSVENQIENMREKCSYYLIIYAHLIEYYDEYLSEDLPQSHKEQLKVIKHFLYSYESYKLPFVIEVTSSGFYVYEWFMGISMKEFRYELKGTMTNQLSNSIVKTEFKTKTDEVEMGWFGNEIPIYAYPKIEVKYGNSTIIDGNKSSYKTYEPGASKESSWKRGEKRNFTVDIELRELGKAHFESTPHSCIISIPFEVECITGETFTTYFKYDIIDDWKKYAEKLRE